MLLASGTQLGSYRVTELLGRGGMAAVYRAEHAEHDRPVALKVLDPALAADPAVMARFQREGRMQASLRHPHVVTVYEAGESEHGWFLAMRVVEGPTLAELIADRALGVRRALGLLDQVAGALDAAHDAGLVHRDVKPQNVLVGDGDHAYLGDFGLVRGETGVSRTATGTLAGTVAYLAPEVARGEAAGPGADRYAFAAMAFECLTGTRVFPRSTEAGVLYAHSSEPPPAISRRRADLPPSLDRVFEDALAKDPRARPATARELVATVRAALEAADALDLEAPRPLDLQPETGDTSERAAPVVVAERRRRWPLLVAAALAGAAAAAVTAVLLDGDDERRTREPAPDVLQGAVAIGSDLAEPGRPLDCRGQRAAEGDCSVLQARLPGRRVVVPEDGVIRRWAVRSARGEVALQVLRPRGGGAFQIARSRNEFVSGDGVQAFPTDLAVEQGDVLALHAVDAAAVGVRPGTNGAQTERWVPRASFQRPPDLRAGSGFDHELLLRAELVPGAAQRMPRQVNGAAAAALPAGRVRRRERLRLGNGRRLTIALVRLGDRFVLDMFLRDRRAARIDVPGFKPEGGRLLQFDAGVTAGERQGVEVYMEYVNGESTRILTHYYSGFPGEFIFVN